MSRYPYSLTIRAEIVRINKSTSVSVMGIVLSAQVALPGAPLTRLTIHTDSLIRTFEVRISESTMVSVVRIAGPQCTVLE